MLVYFSVYLRSLVHKIHVLLKIDSQSLLIVDVTLHLEVSHAWEVNNLVWHGAFNDGDRDRIHFIFEVYEVPDSASGILERQERHCDFAMTRSSRDYRAYGLHIRSPIGLPFAPLSGPPTGEPDVTIRLSTTPVVTPNSIERRGLKPVMSGNL